MTPRFSFTRRTSSSSSPKRTDEDEEIPYDFSGASKIGGAMISGELPPCAVAHASPLLAVINGWSARRA
jgi:hypothetical protein